MESGQSFGQVMKQIGDFVNALTMRQKLTLVAGAAIVIVTLFVFVRLLGKPEMKPLYSGASPADVQEICTRLAEKNIQCQISQDGTSASVSADQLDKARLEVTAKGVPASGRIGFEIFDKANLSSTDFTEKVNYQRALEGELERTIQTMAEVEAVRVHLVVPGDSVFLDDKREAKAAVIVRLRGGSYSEEIHRSISQLVASAVDRLRPENVTVVDADTNRRLDPERSTPPGNNIEDSLAARLVRTLAPVVGEDHIRVNVRVELDPTTMEENRETYDPNGAVALTTQKSEERSGGKSAAGIPGTSTNVPGSSAQSSSQTPADDIVTSSRTESGTYAVSRVQRHTLAPAGRVRRVAAAVLIDDASETRQANGKATPVRRKRTGEEISQIEALAKAAIGVDPARGDVLTVQNLSFEQLPIEPPLSPTPAQRVRTVMNDWSSVLRWLGVTALFLAVYGLLLRPVKKQALAAFRTLQVLPNGTIQTELTPANPAAVELESGIEDDTSLEGRRTAALKRHLVESVKSEPANASKLVQSWIRQGGKG